MSADSRDRVEAALKAWTEPHFGLDLVTAGAVRALEVDAGKVSLDVDLGFPLGA